MKRALIILHWLLIPMLLHAQHYQIDTLSMTGPVNQRINLVFLGDGYKQEQLDRFITDVKWMKDALMAKAPYQNYRDYFNCFAIRVPSQVSGAANDPDSLINNYYGSTFNYANIWRLVVPTRTDRINRVLADNLPFYDQVFMIVNDSRYGGSGGWVATCTVNAAGPEICIHELGHSFAGLSDEYWAGPQYARENTNMTRETDTLKVKWKPWLGFSMTGIFPHSESPEWQRPHQNCEMRYLNRNFCPVCKEATVSKILDMTSPVLSHSPENAAPAVVSDTVFRVSLLPPQPNTLKIRWTLNLNEIARQVDSVNILSGQLINGQNKLICSILDTTSFIRKTSHERVHLHKVVWNILYNPSGTGIESFSDKVTLSVYPNPATDYINLKYQSGRPAQGKLQARLTDSSGKTIGRSITMNLAGTSSEFQIPLPKRNLPAGLYYLVAQSPGQSFTLPVIIR